MTSPTGRSQRGRPPYPGLLTPAEERVLDGLRRGLTNPEIARELGLRRATVKYHVANILAKLDAGSRRELVSDEYRGRRPTLTTAVGVLLRHVPARPVTVTTAGFVAVVTVLAVILQRGYRGTDADVTATPAATTTATAFSPTAAPGTAAPATVEELLQRPVELPALAPGEPCPMTPARALTDDGFPHAGPGPVMIYGESLRRELRWPDGLLGAKILVAVESGFNRGAIVVRGERLDAAGRVLFTTGEPAILAPWVELPQHAFDLRFFEPGCYGLQFDGAGGQHHIVLDIQEPDSFTSDLPGTAFDNPTGFELATRLVWSSETPIVVTDRGDAGDWAVLDEAVGWTGVRSIRGVLARTGRTNVELCLTPPGGSERCVTDNHVFDGHPVWSPDGATLLFESTSTGRRGIWAVDADGSNQRQLAAVPGASDWFPAWSPDGSRIAFVSDRGGRWDVYTMAADGTDIRRVTDVRGSAWAPTYTPDGQWIGFISNREDQPEVWVVRPDRSGLQRVTRTDDTWIDAFAWR